MCCHARGMTSMNYDKDIAFPNTWWKRKTYIWKNIVTILLLFDGCGLSLIFPS